MTRKRFTALECDPLQIFAAICVDLCSNTALTKGWC